MIDAMQVKEALADRLEKQKIGRWKFGEEPPECTIGAFMLTADKRDLLVALLRAPSPAALDPVPEDKK